MTIKQVIVIRKDLNMRKGKMCAQSAHASMKVLLDRGSYHDGNFVLSLADENLRSWLQGDFTKICVSVNSGEELMEIYNKAASLGIPCSLIVDSGKTEFNGVSTITCCAIGPAHDGAIDPLTRHLPLL